jgi:monoamine oxidase
MSMSAGPTHFALPRREFLRRLFALSGATAAASAMPALAAVPETGRPLSIIIVGAGLAGLCAAHELEKRGHRVTILEADPRHIGGRVRTLRFADGRYGEAGAMRIPKGHELTRRYIAEFGVPVRKFVHWNDQAYYFARGERRRVADVKGLYPRYQLREPERLMKAPDELWSRAVSEPAGTLTDAEKKELRADTLKSAKLLAYDQQTLQQMFEGAGLSQEAIELLAITSGSETLLMSAATETLREEIEEVWSKDFDEIVGGTDRFASAFVARLKSKPQLGCVVTRLTQDGSRRRAAAIYREGSAERRVEGDFLLCTLPFPVLSRISVEPDLSGPKWRAIRQLNYDSSTKVLAVTRRRFWEADDGIYGGGTFTDLPTGTTYYPSDNAEAKDSRVSSSPSVMLASYSWGQTARRLGSLRADQREATALGHLARVHPQLGEAGMVRETRSWSWDNHPLAGGAFAWFNPGQHTDLYRHVVAPEGRIYFAGEHASLSHTWMQGALESALRAAREMLEAAQRS